MGIINYKLSEDVPLSVSKFGDGGNYITEFQPEYNDGDLPLKDSEGKTIPQIQMRGDYLIALYGSSDDDKRKGYENFKTFVGELPKVKIVFKKPYNDPYPDAYYNTLGFERVNINDKIYYTTLPEKVLNEVSDRIQNTKVQSPSFGFLVFAAPNYNQAIEHISEHISMYRHNKQDVQIVIKNNARELWNEINKKETANYHNVDDNEIVGNILKAQRKLRKTVPLVDTLSPEVPDDIIETIKGWLMQMSQESLTMQQMEDLSLELIKKMPLKVHGYTEEQYEAQYPITVELAKETFASEADRMWLYENSGIAKNDAELKKRIEYMIKFVDTKDIDELYDTMEFCKGHIIRASRSLKMSPVPIHTEEEVQQIKKNRNVKYGKLYKWVADRKVIYDGVVILVDGEPVAQDQDRYKQWSDLVDQYNKVDSERRLFQKRQLKAQYNIDSANYLNNYNGELGFPPIVGGGSGGIGGWAVAAIIIGLIVIMVVYSFIRSDKEFPVWIHYGASLGTGIAVGAGILGYGYYRTDLTQK